LVATPNRKDVDGREKPGHDEKENLLGQVIAATLSRRQYSHVALQNTAGFPAMMCFPPAP
jgi:hypothetical protein